MMLLLSRFTISGHSMEPTLLQGQTVFASPIPFFFSKPKIGDIVVIRHFGLSALTLSTPLKEASSFLRSLSLRERARVRVDSGVVNSSQNDEEGEFLIKRITKIDPSADGDKYFVSGDNKSDSLDSRRFGCIEKKDILGKVIYF